MQWVHLLTFAVPFTIVAASSVASATIWSHYANFKVSSLFISQWKLIVFTVNEHENIGIAGLNPQAGYFRGHEKDCLQLLQCKPRLIDYYVKKTKQKQNAKKTKERC